jgi:Tol biopolymer transport system component
MGRKVVLVFVAIAVAVALPTLARRSWLVAANGAVPALALPTSGKIALADAKPPMLISVNPDGSARRVLGRCQQLATACRIRPYSWSPDGRRLLFFRADLARLESYSLFVVDASGRNLRRLASCRYCGPPVGSGATWAPSGWRIAFPGAKGLVVADLRRGVTRQLTGCGASCIDLDPAWSPNRLKIAFVRRGSLYTVKPDGSALTKLTSAPPFARHPAWSPDSRQLTFDGTDKIYAVAADGSHQTLLLDGSSGSGPGVPSWSPDGSRILYFNTRGTPGAFTAEVWVMKPDGTDQDRLYQSGCCVNNWSPPIWSPNGQSIAFSADSAGGVLTMNSDGTQLHTLSASPSDIAWQPIP